MQTGFYKYQPFETLIQKTAFLFQSLLIYHPFVDGMKRTGIYSSLAFLLRNDYLLVSINVEDSVKFAIEVADKMSQMDPDESMNKIAGWFNERVIPIREKKVLFKYVCSKQGQFKCPRCANPEVTIANPRCRDCNLQLIKFNFNVDGIVEKRQLIYSRTPDTPFTEDNVEYLNTFDVKIDLRHPVSPIGHGHPK